LVDEALGFAVVVETTRDALPAVREHLDSLGVPLLTLGSGGLVEKGDAFDARVAAEATSAAETRVSPPPPPSQPPLSPRPPPSPLLVALEDVSRASRLSAAVGSWDERGRSECVEINH